MLEEIGGVNDDMKEFHTIEEKVIYSKLIETDCPQKKSSHEQHIALDLSGCAAQTDAGQVSKTILNLENQIRILQETSENFAFRPLYSDWKLIGKPIVLAKKVIRKLLKWYIEPICEQQTVFNNAVTASIEHLAALQCVLLSSVAASDKSADSAEGHPSLTDELAKEASPLAWQPFSPTPNNPAYKPKPGATSFWNKHSVAQAGEDCIAAYIASALSIPMDQCSYLDLGANHAKDLSNTYCFYERGAKGVLVEANPQLIPELTFYRCRDTILNKCVAASSGEKMKFYILNGDGLSTPDYEAAQAFIAKNPKLAITDTVEVDSITVNEIMKNYFKRTPVILSIDIEGKEMAILQSINFAKYRPLVVIIEMIPYRPTLGVGDKNPDIMEFMLGNGYIEFAFTGINSVFIDQNRI